MYTITGKILEILPIENVTGKFKKKQTFVITTDKDVNVMFMLFDNTIDQLSKYEAGDNVIVQFIVKSYKRTHGWENVCFCITIEPVIRTYKRKQEQRRTWNDFYDKGFWEAFGNKTNNPRTETAYFDGCYTPEQIKKKYRELCKKYHPDTGTGNEKIMQEINAQYNKIKRT